MGKTTTEPKKVKKAGPPAGEAEEKPKEEELTEKEEKEIKTIGEVIESKAIAAVDPFKKLTRPQIDLIKRTIAKGASDDELKMFIQVCKGNNLNPFLKQVHLVPFWNAKAAREERVIMVGIDGFRAIAEESGNYAGNEDPTFKGDQDLVVDKVKIIVPTEAFVKVYKVVKGRRCPFTATARWKEYYPGVKKGFQWHKKPYLMLGKCAEALALRKAFPKLLSGMYTEEEMGQAASEGTKVEENQKTFDIFKKTIKKATLKELNECKAKLEKSDKYTKEQKVECMDIIWDRIKKLQKKKKDQ